MDLEDEIKVEPVVEEVGALKPVQKMADLDVDELLAKHPAEEVKEEKEEVKDESAEPSKEPEEKPKDPKAKEEEDIAKAEEEIQGYYADEVLEDEVEPTPVDPKATTPQEQLANYILDNLQPITVAGQSGGKNVQLNVKVVDQLPDDFEFHSSKDQARFHQAIASQAISARQLADRYVSDQQQAENEVFNASERREIASDIAKLQRAGELQTFTPGVNVDEDPRAAEAREVMKFYEEEKTRRLEAANKKERLYHPLSFEDAYYLRKQRLGSVNTEQKAEDAERKEIIKKQANTGRGANTHEGAKRVNLGTGASWDQVINEALKIY